jgi:hypothetical protein
MTPGEARTMAESKLVPATPVLSESGLVVQSAQVPEQGQRKLVVAATVAHLGGLDAKSARRVVAGLYRAVLADALLDCGMDCPVIRRAAGRDK